jgi:hypothetical protein
MGKGPRCGRKGRSSARLKASWRGQGNGWGKAMSDASHRYVVIAEFVAGDRVEQHITEMHVRTLYPEVVKWARGRIDHLDDDLRGRWKYAQITVYDDDFSEPLDERPCLMTLTCFANGKARISSK